MVLNGGVERRAGAVPAPTPKGGKPTATKSHGEAHEPAEEIQTLVLLTAEVVTKDNAATAKAKPAVQR
jgi:hypothetical protein